MKVFELSAIDLTLYKFVLPLMKELKKNGFEVICGAKDYGYLDQIEKEGIRTYDISLSRSLNPISLLKSLFQLRKILKKEQIDIIHVHTPIASMVGRFAALLAGIDIKVYTVHGFILKPKIYYWIEKFMAKHLTDYIFTVNQEDYDTALSGGFIEKAKLLNINSVGIDIEDFNPERFLDDSRNIRKKELGIESNVPIIGFVGRIVRSKGVLDLVEAFLEIRKYHDCKLLLVGPWDFDERSQDNIIEEIQTIRTKNSLEKDIILLGHREDVANVLSVMDIFVLPSYREGMPVSLLEAMAMEKAVIGTNIRGVREEITPDTGLIYEPRDVKQLTKQILYYLKHKETMLQMGKNARQRVIQNFSKDLVIKKQMDVFGRFKQTK